MRSKIENVTVTIFLWTRYIYTLLVICRYLKINIVNIC